MWVGVHAHEHRHDILGGVHLGALGAVVAHELEGRLARCRLPVAVAVLDPGFQIGHGFDLFLLQRFLLLWTRGDANG